MTFKGDCMDMQHMIFQTCTVLPLKDTEGTCSMSPRRRTCTVCQISVRQL